MLFETGHRDAGLAAADRGFLDVGEDRGQAVEVLRGERVELVVVALAAAHRLAQPHGRHVAHPVGVVLRQVLLRLGAALLGRLEQAVVGGADARLQRRARQQVAGELLPRETVETLVDVERADDVVAVRADVHRVVAVVADGVGVADQIEPVHRHALAVVGRIEQAVHELLVSVRRFVIDERGDLGARGRQAGEVERQAADKRDAVGLGRGREVSFLEFRKDEPVDGRVDVYRFASRKPFRQRGPGRLDIRPVALPRGALLDPQLEQRDLPRRQRLAGRRRGHAPLRVLLGDALVQLALVQLAGDDGAFLGAVAEEPGLRVEAEVGLALVLVGAVTLEAVVGQDRLDVAVEIDGLRQRRRGPERRSEQR